MSSDEEQEEGGRRGGRMAFTDQNDFEGGRWINGEFFYENRRVGETQTKDEKLYGVFGEVSSDEDDGGGVGGRGKKKGGRNKGQQGVRRDLSKPVGFVGDSGRGGAGSAISDSRIGGGRNGKSKQGASKPKVLRSGADDETDVESDGQEDNADLENDGSDGDDDTSPGGNSSRYVPGQNPQKYKDLLDAATKPTNRTPGGAPEHSSPPPPGRGLGLGEVASSTQGVPPPTAAARSNADFSALFRQSAAAPPVASQAPVAGIPGTRGADNIIPQTTAAKAPPGTAGGSGLGSRAAAGLGFESAAKGGLGSGAAGGGVGRAGVAAQNGKEAVPRKPAKPAKLDANFGSWEKNTKGFASKMMAKMGFKGRLGKHEDGVTRQLEVKVRPGLSGLGFGNFKEATTLKVNREIEADRRGMTVEQMDAELGLEAAGKGRGKGPKSKAEEMAEKGLWRKGAKGKKRKRYVTAEELLAQQEEEAKGRGETAAAAPKQIIVDMRGPQAKLISSMEDLAPLATGLEDGEKPKLGQELLHNVGLMVGLAETEIQTLHRRRQAEKDRAAALSKDAADLRKRVEASGERLSRIEQVETILAHVHDKVESDPGAVSADHILKVFHTLRERFPEEYAVFGLAQLVPAMAAPVIKRSLAGWSPLKAPAEPASLLVSWKDVLLDTSGAVEGQGRARRWEGQAAFEFLANDLVLPAVRSALVNEWEVRDPTPALQLAEAMVLAGVGDEIVQTLLEQVILPKLTRGVTEWNPRTDKIAIHMWIHPWLPLLGSRLAGVFPEIRRKLAAVLVHWHPSDTSAYAMLSPWTTVFDSRSMEALLLKSIVPKLVEGVRASLVINPANQDMTAFNMLMMWSDVIPPLYFTSILDGEFFPKWLTVLHRWLSDTADYAEVAKWYQGWKDCFPEHLKTDPRLMAHFNSALNLMEQVMADHQQQGVPLPAGASEEMSYRHVVERRAMEAAALQRQQLQQQQQQQMQMQLAAGRAAAGPAASFREVVEAFAEANGITFLPKPGRQQEGKQIYSFGGVSVYLDQSVAFTEKPRGSGRWSPLSLEDLLLLTGSGNRQTQNPPTAAGAAGASSQNGVGSSHAFDGID